MGCNISKIHGTEVVLRCQRRKSMIRDALKYRTEFASAHSAYLQVLVNVGSALYKFSDRQLFDLEISPSIYSCSETLPQKSIAAYSIPSKPSNLASTSSIFVMNSQPSIATHSSIHIDSSKNNTEQSKDDQPSNDGNSELPPKDKLIAPIKNSATLDSIHAHQTRAVSPIKSFNSPSDSYSPERSLSSGHIMDPFWSSLHSPLSVSTSESSTWDPFHIWSSPIPLSHTQEQFIVVQNQELEYLVESAKEEGMPDLEEDHLDVKMEHSYINKVGRNNSNVENIEASAISDTNEVKKTSAHNHEKIEEKSRIIRSNEDKNKNKEKGAKITEAISMKGPETRIEAIDAIRETIRVLSKFAKELNDLFIEASECGNEVSKVLEIQSVDQANYSNESFRFASTTTRHWPHRAPLDCKGVNKSMDAVDLDSLVGSHSLTLETLYAWEKKLYKEAKVWEHLRVACAKKRRQFNVFEHEKRDAHLIEETRAAMEILNSQLAVAFNGISSTSARIEQITTKELYPQLVELLKRLTNMWKAMHQYHMAQKTVAIQIRNLGQLDATFKASNTHINANIQLIHELREWQDSLSIWLKSQQKYISFLLDWIRVCHMEPEINVMTSLSMSPIIKTKRTPIYVLVGNWNDSLIWLGKYLEASDAIYKFAEALHSLQLSNIEELKHEEMRMTTSYSKGHSFWHTKKACSVYEVGSILQREDCALSILKKHLLSVFEMLSTVSSIAVKEYEHLYSTVESAVQNQNLSSEGAH